MKELPVFPTNEDVRRHTLADNGIIKVVGSDCDQMGFLSFNEGENQTHLLFEARQMRNRWADHLLGASAKCCFYPRS
jgi:hypothetical protein